MGEAELTLERVISLLSPKPSVVGIVCKPQFLALLRNELDEKRMSGYCPRLLLLPTVPVFAHSHQSEDVKLFYDAAALREYLTDG